MPVRNEARRIATALEAVLNQTLAPVEIIVVDGRSTDDTVAIAMAYGARVLFEGDRTRAGACQEGLLAATGEFVAFTDADCVPEPTWLERLHAGFAHGIVGVGGRIENRGDTFWQHAVNGALDTVLGSANSVQGRPFRDRRDVTSISGCNSMYRKADLLGAGGFRRELVTTEDTELNRRMLERGRLLYVPDAVVHHRHERGLRDFARRMIQYGYGRGQSLLPGPPMVLALLAPAAIVFAAFAPGYGLGFLGLYALALLASAVWPAVRRKRLALVLAIPVVLAIEHVCYAFGFWKGLVLAHGGPKRRSAETQRESA
ncbi:MAG: hypothetical protein A3K68_04070 [Euryarchaeota archaeon RBG_16_68_13]|nr:MAG: hypothetical protein A3K68_04070 [Euryarchaeota archaeon RBG_16_68_13]